MGRGKKESFEMLMCCGEREQQKKRVVQTGEERFLEDH